VAISLGGDTTISFDIGKRINMDIFTFIQICHRIYTIIALVFEYVGIM
jgi:hypothetical protein